MAAFGTLVHIVLNQDDLVQARQRHCRFIRDPHDFLATNYACIICVVRVQKGFLCCPLQIVVVHTLPHHLDPLLRHCADA